jgi:hypothetical protein
VEISLPIRKSRVHLSNPGNQVTLSLIYQQQLFNYIFSRKNKGDQEGMEEDMIEVSTMTSIL